MENQFGAFADVHSDIGNSSFQIHPFNSLFHTLNKSYSKTFGGSGKRKREKQEILFTCTGYPPFGDDPGLIKGYISYFPEQSMKKYAFVAILLNIWIVSLENVTLSPIKEDLLQTFQPYWIEICTLIAIIGPISIHNVSKEILVPGGDICRNLVLFKLVKERFEKRQ